MFYIIFSFRLPAIPREENGRGYVYACILMFYIHFVSFRLPEIPWEEDGRGFGLGGYQTDSIPKEETSP